MKPNEKQLSIIKAIESCCEVWKTSNDISSPSHYSLIYDEACSLFEEGIVNSKDGHILRKNLEELYNFINSK
jgi:hypothetical protein